MLSKVRRRVMLSWECSARTCPTKNLSIQSIAHLWFGARRTWTPLPSFLLSFPREGRAAPRSINRSGAGRSHRLRRCRTLQPQARSTESWLNLTFPAGLMSCNRRCGEHAKSCGKDVGLLWDLKGIGVNTRSPRFPRTGVMGFRCFSENSYGKTIPFAKIRDFTGTPQVLAVFCSEAELTEIGIGHRAA